MMMWNYSRLLHPGKLYNMEPTNHPIEKENHLPSTSILEFKMLKFPGCRQERYPPLTPQLTPVHLTLFGCSRCWGMVRNRKPMVPHMFLGSARNKTNKTTRVAWVFAWVWWAPETEISNQGACIKSQSSENEFCKYLEEVALVTTSKCQKQMKICQQSGGSSHLVRYLQVISSTFE